MSCWVLVSFIWVLSHNQHRVGPTGVLDEGEATLMCSVVRNERARGFVPDSCAYTRSSCQIVSAAVNNEIGNHVY